MDNNLDNAFLALPYQLKGLFCLLEREPVRDELLDINLAAGYEIYCHRIASCRITD